MALRGSDSDGSLAACLFDGKNVSVALLTTATGTLKAGTFRIEEAISLFSSFRPAEILVKNGQAENLKEFYPECTKISIVERERGEFDIRTSSEWLCRKWGIATMNSMGLDDRIRPAERPRLPSDILRRLSSQRHCTSRS